MPRCCAITQRIDQCANTARPGEEYCGIHLHAHQGYAHRFGPRLPEMCHFVNSGGRCEFPHEAGQTLCMHHRHVRERRLAREAEERAHELFVQTTFTDYFDQNPQPTWQNVLVELANRMRLPVGFPGYLPRTVADDVARAYFRHPEINPEHRTNTLFFVRIWRWVRLGGPDTGEPIPLVEDAFPPQGPVAMPLTPPPPVQRLQALAQDQQNVHTREVSDQTNESTRKLLDVVVPLTQKTEQTLMLAWYALPNQPAHHRILKTAVDVNKWFNTETCRQNGDKLYKHVLRGLVAYISQVRDPDLKQELWGRAWEECSESVGMCCEGHISRLCNVLVGFDEAFKPPVPFSEILQNKMAAIAGMDVSIDEKIQQATTFFNEYAVPEDQRQAWLDAF